MANMLNCARARARADAERANNILTKKIARAVDKLQLQKADRAFLDRVIGKATPSNSVRMSCLPAIQQSSVALAEALIEYIEERHDNLHPWMVTICDDDGLTSLNRPQISIKKLYRKIDKILRRFEIHALLFLEVEVILNHPNFRRPRIHLHFHGICWSDTEIKPKNLAKRMMRSNALTNSLGAPSIKFTRASTPNAESLGGLAYYVTKPPASVKRREEDSLRPGRFVLKSDPSKLSGRRALRLAEIMSHINLYDSVRAVGEGKDLRRIWKRKLTHLLGVSGYAKPENKTIRQGWSRLRRNNPTYGYKKVKLM